MRIAKSSAVLSRPKSILATQNVSPFLVDDDVITDPAGHTYLVAVPKLPSGSGQKINNPWNAVDLIDGNGNDTGVRRNNARLIDAATNEVELRVRNAQRSGSDTRERAELVGQQSYAWGTDFYVKISLNVIKYAPSIHDQIFFQLHSVPTLNFGPSFTLRIGSNAADRSVTARKFYHYPGDVNTGGDIGTALAADVASITNVYQHFRMHFRAGLSGQGLNQVGRIEVSRRLETEAAWTSLVDFTGDFGTQANFTFSSGGTYVLTSGDTVVGATSGATAVVDTVTVTSGSFAAGTAAGSFTITSQSGAFALNEDLNVGANLNVASLSSSGGYKEGLRVQFGIYSQGSTGAPSTDDGYTDSERIIRAKNFEHRSSGPYPEF